MLLNDCIFYGLSTGPKRLSSETPAIPIVFFSGQQAIYSPDSSTVQVIKACGQQYEAENSNCVIERRQYGVDGDSRCNYDAIRTHAIVAEP